MLPMALIVLIVPIAAREGEREREKKTITNSTYRRADRRDKSKENEQRAKSNAKNT